jgi:hypothetical protein
MRRDDDFHVEKWGTMVKRSESNEKQMMDTW